MADLTAADVTYTIIRERITETQGRYENIVDITFGDGVKTVSDDGLPLIPSLLGLPSGIIEAIILIGAESKANLQSNAPVALNITTNPITNLFLTVVTPQPTIFRLLVIGY